MSINIVGFYTQGTCQTGKPQKLDDSVTALVAKDENGTVQIVSPPFSLEEVTSLWETTQCETESPIELAAIYSIEDPTAVAALRSMERIRRLALEIKNEYPWQNMIQIRSLFNNLDNPPENIPDELKPLYQKKETLIASLNELTETVSGLDRAILPEVVNIDLDILLQAKNLLEVVEWALADNIERLNVITPAGVPSYYIEVDPNNTNLAVFSKLAASPKVVPTTESTQKAEEETNKGGAAIAALDAFYTAQDPIPEQRPFEFYIDAYGIDRSIPVPGLEKLKASLASFKGEVTNPFRIWISDFGYRRVGPETLEVTYPYCDRYIDLDQHAPIFQFIKSHEAGYREAAMYLHQSHPEISYNTLVTFLMVNTFVELFWSQGEDPWQDTGAALAYKTEQADLFSKTYEHYTASTEDGGLGYRLGVRVKKENKDVIYNVAPSKWEWASMKVPVESQGLGPNAVIIGDFLKAGEYDNGALWSKYFPALERTKENAVKIALDPQLSVKAVALVYDAKLRELDRTIFSNPEVRMPDNVYPYFKDPKQAREYFKLSWVRYIKAFPEVAANFPEFFPYGHNTWNIDYINSYFKIVQAVLGQPDSWPDLQMDFIPSKGKPINDYFGDKEDPNNMDALMLFTTPKE